MSEIRTAFFGLGSNLGDRENNLELAIKGLQANLGMIFSISSIYETESWGLKEQPDYLNQVVAFRTYKSARQLLNEILILEKKMGRVRDVKWGPRKIDIDLLFLDDLCINEPGLRVPHPHIQDRKFVLAPLDEIATDFIHPELNVDIETLLENCKDEQEVKKCVA